LKPNKDRERELEREYILQGMSYKRARSQAKARYVREYVGYLRIEDPTEYARLQKMLNNTDFAESERQRRERERYLEVHTRRERALRALVDVGLPLPFIAADDFVAFRSWTINGGGRIQGVGAGSGYEWKEVNFADCVPTEWNQHGFYCWRINAQTLVTGGIGGYFDGRAAGLVALSGKIVEHADGVLRAECARIRCIWYLPNVPADAYLEVPWLRAAYPTTPLFVTTKARAADALLRIAVMLEWRDGEDFVESFGMRGQR